MKKFLLGLIGLLISIPVFSITPQFWVENSQQSFADGNPQSVSIRSDGVLSLAPGLKRTYEGKEAIVWKLVSDSKKNIYAATGNEARIIKILPDGTSSQFFKADELSVQTLTIDKHDNVYAATSPDGKIYKISSDGKSSVFFDPSDKYIWSLALDPDGNVYAGTGGEGKIYKIDKDGKGTVLADTNENNITALAWTKEGKLLAGSDPNGILYSIDPNGRVFVVFDADLQQITSIYTAASGDVYFAAIAGVPVMLGPRQAPDQQPQPTVIQAAPQGQDSDQDEGTVVTTVEMEPIAPLPQLAPQKISGASNLYKLTDSGSAEILYASPDDQILDISEVEQGTLLISTGKKAKLISVSKARESSVLLKAAEEQITSLLLLDGKTWLSTANPGNVYQVIENHSSKGTYFSNIKDTETTSTWGRISWKATVPTGTSLSLYTRSGNTKTPDDTWSDWQSMGTDPEGKQVSNPKARFVQWKAEFSTTDTGVTPELQQVSLAYLQKNTRPDIVSLTVHPAGTLFRASGAYGSDAFAGVDEDQPVDQTQDSGASLQGMDIASTGKKEYRKGYQSITWAASDDNQDDLRSKVYYRMVGSKNWKLLAENLKDKVFAWDTETMPDGTYQVKVEVDDRGSNPAELTLEDSRESETFDVDNTAPSVKVVSVTPGKDGVLVQVQANDQSSPIRDMKYSVKPGEWVSIFPEDSINDSRAESYKIMLKGLPADEDSITLQCTDSMQNVSTIQHSLK